MKVLISLLAVLLAVHALTPISLTEEELQT